MKKQQFAVAHPHSGYSSTDSRSNWNLECFSFSWALTPYNFTNTSQVPYLRTILGTHCQKGLILHLRTKNLKNQTLSLGTYLYSPSMGVLPLPPGFSVYSAGSFPEERPIIKPIHNAYAKNKFNISFFVHQIKPLLLITVESRFNEPLYS